MISVASTEEIRIVKIAEGAVTKRGTEWLELHEEVKKLTGTLRWVHRNIDRIRDWSGVPDGVLLVVDHIRDEIATKVEVEE